ncbi:MAG: HupE/UreJ family protein [Candidatus Jettenia sp.]|nr:HupE/UreJ family protein [Candidatus Jettenia sp.]
MKDKRLFIFILCAQISFLSFWSFLVTSRLEAHEVRPAYLQLTELQSGRYAVLWKVPARGDMVLHLEPELPVQCKMVDVPQREFTTGASVMRWTIDCGPQGLTNGTISIHGLRKTMTDVLVQIERLDGSSQTALLQPGSPSLDLNAEALASIPVVGYLKLGVEHILFGIDHLLFILGLILIVGRRWGLLIKTITAFTAAHSITLALAMLNVVRVPQAPVEAVIALSIMFVAAEVLHIRQGRYGLAMRLPWIVAFIFGLLHGFGFAGALSEIGLPQDSVALALLFFNLGVEIGQLLFVITIKLIIKALKQIPVNWPTWTELVPPYMIGGLAAFWTIQRVVSFL